VQDAVVAVVGELGRRVDTAPGNLQSLQPGATVPVTLTRADGSQEVIACRCRIDTE
jgi:aconitase A